MSTFTPTISHPEADLMRQKQAEEKALNNSASNNQLANDSDINRSEGEGMGTTSYHNTINNQTTHSTIAASSSDMKWSEAILDDRKLGRKLSDATNKFQNKVNETDAKYGVSKKLNELDQKYNVTASLEKTGKKLNDIAVHFGRSLSRGHIKHAFTHSMDAGKIGECERRKHDPKGLGPPAWIPESDTEGLVWGSRGTDPTPNEVLSKEEQQ